MGIRTSQLVLAAFLATAMLNYGQEAKKSDADKFQGKWKIASLVHNGKKGTVPIGKSIVFTGEKVFMERWTPDSNDSNYVFKLNETTEPKSIDMVNLDVEKWKPDLCIYRFDGADLVICIPLRNLDRRPKAFEEPNNVIVTLKREKK
jgi:uncharacterized protein (TIGR03067 family)